MASIFQKEKNEEHGHVGSGRRGFRKEEKCHLRRKKGGLNEWWGKPDFPRKSKRGAGMKGDSHSNQLHLPCPERLPELAP